MSTTALEKLKEAWPGRITLRADEVALVLRGKTTRRVVERVRGKMKDGTYGEGARKVDGVWQLPLTDLAEVIEPTPQAPQLPILSRLPPKISRRRSAIGPRVSFIRDAVFWSEVLRAMGMVQDAEELAREADEILRGLREEYRANRAARSRAGLLEDLDMTDKGVGPDRVL